RSKTNPKVVNQIAKNLKSPAKRINQGFFDPSACNPKTGMEAVNARSGSGGICPSSTGLRRTWRLRGSLLSARYTTRFSEIVNVRNW
ncbi:DUF4113 domain-containing protein, partial [Gluconobacter cerinus]|nr:DUF4113 domain-containing protein [Gluconobacter cerinus]